MCGGGPQEKLLWRQGQQGWNHLLDLLQAELAARPSDPHVNAKLVALYRQDGRLDEALSHCLAVERRGLLRHSLDWSAVLLDTLRVSSRPANQGLTHTCGPRARPTDLIRRDLRFEYKINNKNALISRENLGHLNQNLGY